MATKCPAAAHASPNAVGVHADAVVDSALPDRARDVTPSGTSHCKNADSNARASPRTGRNNQVDHTSVPQNSRPQPPCAYPRAPPDRLPTTLPAHAAVPDNADSPHAAADAPCRWPGNPGLPSPDANASLPHGIADRNNAPADDQERTNVHNPSANSDEHNALASTLAGLGRDDEMTMGPREVVLPKVKSRSPS